MKLIRSISAIVLIISLGAAAYGEEDKRWSGNAELSFVDTGGNTDVTTLSLKNVLKYSFDEQTVGTWRLNLLKGQSDGATNAERYFTELRLDHSYNERLYSYGNAGWFKDRFAGFDYRIFVGAGGGYRFITGPKHILSGEAGLTFTDEEYTDNTGNNYLGGRLYGLYEYAFTKRNRFSQSLTWLLNFDKFKDWDIISETALTSALNSFLSLKASYLVTYDNEPVPGFKRTDTTLSIALVADY